MAADAAWPDADAAPRVRSVVCVECGRRSPLGDAHAGDDVVCAHCGTGIVVGRLRVQRRGTSRRRSAPPLLSSGGARRLPRDDLWAAYKRTVLAIALVVIAALVWVYQAELSEFFAWMIDAAQEQRDEVK